MSQCPSPELEGPKCLHHPEARFAATHLWWNRAARVYVCYGLQKSASSFVFQITQEALRRLAAQQGIAFVDLHALFPGCKDPNFAEGAMTHIGIPLDSDGLERFVEMIEAKLRGQGGGCVVIKTHLASSPGLRARIEAGEILASATFRHPADMILSRMDMAKRLGEEGLDDYERVYREYLATQIPAFETWRPIRNALFLHFDLIAISPFEVSRRIVKHVGADTNPAELADRLVSDRTNIWQFNKGVLDRHRTELPDREICRIARDFASYIEFMDEYMRQERRSWLCIAIVTPCLNGRIHIDETIASVVTQRGDFKIRYHVQDGGSSDGTPEQLQRWKDLLSVGSNPMIGCKEVEFTFSVEPDSGVYDALNRGFRAVQGDVYTWLGADDRLLPGSLQSVATLLKNEEGIHWITGLVNLCREDGVPYSSDPRVLASSSLPSVHPQWHVALGLADGQAHPIIQQEGTFWTHWLWSKVGARLDTRYRLAGDFELWTRMALHAELVTVQAPLATFRKRVGQLSGSMDKYMEEVRCIQEVARTRHDDEPGQGEGAVACNASIAYIPMSTGNWRWDSLGPREMDWIQTWLPLGGISAPEGPFPEQGILHSFRWLTGPRAHLRVTGKRPGWHVIRMSFHNFHKDQRLRLTGPGIDMSIDVPVTFGSTAPLETEFRANIPPSGCDLTMECAQYTSTPLDPRELAVAICELACEYADPQSDCQPFDGTTHPRMSLGRRVLSRLHHLLRIR